MARILRSTSGQTCQADLRTFLSLLKFGLRHHVGSLGAQLFKRGDTFLLAHFLNVSAVGYYAIALTAYELLLSVPRAISGLLAGESSARPGELAAVLVSRTARQVLWVMIIVAILVSVLAIPFVPLLYGQDFNRSVPPLLLLLAAAVSLGAAISLQAYFLGIGRPGLNGSLTLASGLANLWLSLWLIPLAGLVGNALATLLGCLLNFTLHLLWFRRLANVPLRAVVLPTTDDFGVWRKGIHRARILLGS
jgi:O-antigen/teichoic acid export membrane protein